MSSYIYDVATKAIELMKEVVLFLDGSNYHSQYRKDADGFYIIPEDQLDSSDSFLEKVYQYEKSVRGSAQATSVAADQEGAIPMPTLKEGSITKRKDGRWMGQYYDNGTKKAVYAPDKLGIIIKVNNCIRVRDQNAEADRRGVAKKITLSEFIDVWFESWKVATSRAKPLSERTIGYVKSTVIKYVRDHKLAKKPISKVTADELDTILNDIPTKYLQGRTYGYLRLVYDKAIQKDILSKNTFDRIDKRAVPTAKKKTMPDIATWLEFMDWLKVESIDIYYLAKFLASTGLRIGEALALTWNDIDKATMRISVSKSFSIATHTLVNHPKTEAGIRRVPIFQDALEVLEDVPKEKKLHEVFWFLSKWVCSKQFTRFVRHFGKFELTVHGLRHFFASLCRLNGIDKKTYSRWMGHENVTMTDDYTHEISEFEQQQIAKMAKLSLNKH